MKKSLFGFVALAGMLAATSCSNDDLTAGKEASVNFAVTLDHVAVTRSISNGMTVNKVYYQVYDATGQTLVTKGDAEVSGLSATIENVPLVSGTTYQVAFWAQDDACTMYDVTDLRDVQIDYEGAMNNDESMDAFCTALTAFEVNGDMTQPVTLKRPFAQINVGVPTENTFGIETSSMTISDAYTQLNILKGTVDGLEKDVTFGMANIPGAEEELTVDQVNYAYVSTTYVLAPVEPENVDLEFAFKGTSTDYTLNYSNTPIQRNYRTNILTDQQNDMVNFTITIDPAYEGDNETLNGDLQETDNLVTVSDVKVTEADGNVSFSANFTGNVTSASFVCTPITRATDGVITVQATVGDGVLTATKSASEFTAPSYTVSVNVNGQPVVGGSTETFTPSTGGEEPDQPGSEEVTYTASWDTYGKNGSNSNYAGSGDMEMEGITWTLEGNSQINPWRLGGKSLTNQDRSIFNITAIPGDITSIEINNGTASLTVNSITVVVASDSDFSSTLFTQTYEYTSDGTITVTKPANEKWENAFVKVTYNVTTSGSSNQFVQLKSLVVNAVK